MKDFLKGIFGNYHTDRASSTKFWNGIGILTITGMFIYLGVYKEIPEWLGWIYAFMITPSRLMKNLVDLRWGRGPGDK